MGDVVIIGQKDVGKSLLKKVAEESMANAYARDDQLLSLHEFTFPSDFSLSVEELRNFCCGLRGPIIVWYCFSGSSGFVIEKDRILLRTFLSAFQVIQVSLRSLAPPKKIYQGVCHVSVLSADMDIGGAAEITIPAFGISNLLTKTHDMLSNIEGTYSPMDHFSHMQHDFQLAVHEYRKQEGDFIAHLTFHQKEQGELPRTLSGHYQTALLSTFRAVRVDLCWACGCLFALKVQPKLSEIITFATVCLRQLVHPRDNNVTFGFRVPLALGTAALVTKARVEMRQFLLQAECSSVWFAISDFLLITVGSHLAHCALTRVGYFAQAVMRRFYRRDPSHEA